MSSILSYDSRMDMGDLGEVSSQIQEIHRHDKGQQCTHLQNS